MNLLSENYTPGSLVLVLCVSKYSVEIGSSITIPSGIVGAQHNIF